MQYACSYICRWINKHKIIELICLRIPLQIVISVAIIKTKRRILRILIFNNFPE